MSDGASFGARSPCNLYTCICVMQVSWHPQQQHDLCSLAAACPLLSLLLVCPHTSLYMLDRFLPARSSCPEPEAVSVSHEDIAGAVTLSFKVSHAMLSLCGE